MKNIIEKLGITPLPWYRTYWDNKDGIYKNDERSDIQHGDSYNICDCVYSEADGKLFFAAPEMLEAIIKWVLSGERTREFKDVVQTEIDFKSIIEKATGKTWAEIKELCNE